MQVKCKYCGADISNTDERCKNCGAVNDQLVRTANGAPKTIEELKSWYVEHNLPDEKTTRFFIGKDIKEARAFGIYKDEQTGNYVVYKNKDTGKRAVRYEGNDEAYAVNELYQRLKEEIQNQKINNKKSKRKIIEISNWFLVQLALIFILLPIGALLKNSFIFGSLVISLALEIMILFPLLSFNSQKMTKESITRKAKKATKWWSIISIIIALLLLAITLFDVISHRNDAYYENNNVVYYHYGTDWYYYDNDSWSTYNGDTSNFNYLDDDYSSSYNASDFEESSYYKESKSWGSSSSDSDWDSDSSWDSSDSWDSGGTDWSSDW